MKGREAAYHKTMTSISRQCPVIVAKHIITAFFGIGETGTSGPRVPINAMRRSKAGLRRATSVGFPSRHAPPLFSSFSSLFLATTWSRRAATHRSTQLLKQVSSPRPKRAPMDDVMHLSQHMSLCDTYPSGKVRRGLPPVNSGSAVDPESPLGTHVKL